MIPTLFINLTERKDRYIEVTDEFKKCGFEEVERYPANKTTNGAIGCTLSHIGCLTLAIERQYPYVFICEDDIQFMYPSTIVDDISKQIQKENWDVIIVSGNNAPPFKRDPTDNNWMQVYNCQTTTGYIVAKHYYQKLLNNFKSGLQQLIANPTMGRMYAIDIYWKQLQTTDRWYMMTPVAAVQRPSYSNVENRFVDYRNLMLDEEKLWLYRR